MGDSCYLQIRDNRYDWFGERSLYHSAYPPHTRKLLARALGVDAVMLGLVRSSTYLSGGLLGFNQGGTAEIVLQFQLILNPLGPPERHSTQ